MMTSIKVVKSSVTTLKQPFSGSPKALTNESDYRIKL